MTGQYSLEVEDVSASGQDSDTKTKELNLDLWSITWVEVIFVSFGSFQSTQTHKHMEKYSARLTYAKRNAGMTGSDTSGLVGKYAFLEVGSVWKAEVDTSSTAVCKLIFIWWSTNGVAFLSQKKKRNVKRHLHVTFRFYALYCPQ